MKVTGFVNARIYASFKPLRVVNGLLVASGRVIYCGSNDLVKQLTTALGGELIDLEGRVVLPGFIDAHLHVESLGLSLVTLDLRGVRSIRELKEKLKKYAEEVKTEWIIGRGWDQDLFEERRWPTRWDLDEVVRDRPVILVRVCGHAAVLNTRALEVTGLISSQQKEVMRDPSGEPTGMVFESAAMVARQKSLESFDVKDYANFIEVAQDHLLSHGVTAVGYVSCGLKPFRALLDLWSKGKLKVRFRVYMNHVDNSTDVVELLRNLGVKLGFGDEYLKVMGIKVIADGGLGARTAWLSEPYDDDPSTSGYPVIDKDTLAKISKLSEEAGLQMSIHAIGDKTLDMVLEVYKGLPLTSKLRHRVDHASLVRDDQINEILKIGAVPVVQPHFIITDWWAGYRVGPKRLPWLYRFKSMLYAGIPIAFSTDAPVEPVNPWRTIYAAVTRGKYDNVPYYEHTKHEALDIIDALHAYTAGSAYSLHEESELGSLIPGSYADFIVVDRDPLTALDVDLKNIKVIATYVGGSKAWPK